MGRPGGLAKGTITEVNDVPEMLSMGILSNSLLNIPQVNESEAHRKQGTREGRSVVKHHSIIHSDTCVDIYRSIQRLPPSGTSNIQTAPKPGIFRSKLLARGHNPPSSGDTTGTISATKATLAKRDWTDGPTHEQPVRQHTLPAAAIMGTTSGDGNGTGENEVGLRGGCANENRLVGALFCGGLDMENQLESMRGKHLGWRER